MPPRHRTPDPEDLPDELLDEAESDRTRRFNGEGSVYQEPDGTWRAALTVKRGRVQKRRASSRADGFRKLREMRAELARGIAADRRMKLGTLLDDWLAGLEAGGRRPRTWEAYEICVRLHITPHLGEIRVSELAPSDVRGLYRDLTDPPTRRGKPLWPPISAAYVAKVRSALVGALDQAVEDEIVARNVARLVKPPKVEKYQATPLTLDETKRALTAIADHPHGPFWELLLATGFRFAEAAGVLVTDVDLAELTVKVDEIIARLPTRYRRARQQSWERAETKTDTSEGTLPLPAFGGAAVARQLVLRAELARQAGDRWVEHGLLFTNRFGGPLRNDHLNERWHKAMERAGVSRCRLHDLRHTFGTLHRRFGTDLKDIQDLLRHAAIGTTADTYVHVVPEALREAADRYDALLATAAGTTTPASTPTTRHTPEPPGRN